MQAIGHFAYDRRQHEVKKTLYDVNWRSKLITCGKKTANIYEKNYLVYNRV